MPNVKINVQIYSKIYLKNPMDTNLGRRILEYGILVLDELGFEKFNFKHLAARIQSTEASIYRYFENKYMLLTYLTAWYWDFLHYKLTTELSHITDPLEKLNKVVVTLTYGLDSSLIPDFIHPDKLHTIIVENASKVYHTKNVDALNNDGFYYNYKKIVHKIAEIILEKDSTFKYPKALAINIIEQSLNYEFYLDHLPALTDETNNSYDSKKSTIKAIQYMIQQLFKSK